MKSKTSLPKAVCAVVQKLGRTRFPVSPAPETVEEWQDATLVPSEIKFSTFSSECVGCRGCELACAYHREKENNPRFSRVHIVKNVLHWLEGKADRPFEVKVCRQCPGISPCMVACPVEGAITRDPKTGAVIINDELCIRCKKCVEACPFEAVWYEETADKILKCDLCGGEPKCMKWCPIGCLELEKVM